MFADVFSSSAANQRRTFVSPSVFYGALGLALGIGVLFRDGWAGSVLALPIGLILVWLLVGRPAATARRAPLLTGLAVLNWLSLLLSPGVLNITLMWIALALLVITTRGGGQADAYDLLRSIATSSATTLPAAARQRAILAQPLRTLPGRLQLSHLVLPIFAVGVFGALLVAANPVIETMVTTLRWDVLADWAAIASPIAIAISLVLMLTLWNMQFHPSPRSWDVGLGDDHWRNRYLGVAPVLLSLVLLNLMFASANLLDLHYVWQDGVLPPGLTHAAYVHRGAYSLIATAILAGAFMVFTLRPGSATAESPAARFMVYLWTAQNMLLVASSAKRTLAYVDDYGMSLWRLSGLVWMGVVALGLCLIVISIVWRRGTLWLINRNLAMAFLVLTACGLVDFSAVVASWNVSRALAQLPEAADATATLPLDAEYLLSLGPSALPAARRLTAAQASHSNLWLPSGNLAWVAPHMEDLLQQSFDQQQGNWRSWTLRNFFGKAPSVQP